MAATLHGYRACSSIEQASLKEPYLVPAGIRIASEVVFITPSRTWPSTSGVTIALSQGWQLVWDIKSRDPTIAPVPAGIAREEMLSILALK